MSLHSRWAPALRVARREALRARGRSILVVTMIALPVLGVAAADIVLQTSEITGTEAVGRRLGTADARITVPQGGLPVAQTVDPEVGGWTPVGHRHVRPTLDDISAALGRDVHAVQVVAGGALVETDAGIADVQVTELDLADDLTRGLYRITDGRVPTSPDEVAINTDLAGRGLGLGDDLVVRDGPTLTVVGIGENASYRGYPIAVGVPGSFDLRTVRGENTWLVDAGGPVTWDDVRRLNELGATVLSRAVLADPPAESELDPDVQGFAPDGPTDDELAVVVLVVVMALLEVVLLAGPAFAVIARRQQRSLALMAATGATPPQARRVVLASGLVLGAVGATVGLGLGLLVAWLSLPVVQRFSNSFLGPYDVPWAHLAVIAGLGLLSALLAAVVPAWLASRQDVVAVLAGRRGDRRPSVRSPLLGLLLLGGGVGGAVWGATRGGPYSIAVAAVVSVLGMVLLVPLVVAALARGARRLPLPLRFAVRDAARHRTRTVPAIAAVAATVAGVVALGISVSSDAALNEATYTPMLHEGQAALSSYAKQDWSAYRTVVERVVPDAQVIDMTGIPEDGRVSREVVFRVPGAGRHGVLSSWSGTFAGTPVSTDGRIPASVLGLNAAEREACEEVLGSGGVVVFTDRPGLTADEATVIVRAHSRRTTQLVGRATVPAVLVRVSGVDSVGQGIVSADAARAAGVEPQTVGLLVDGAEISPEQEQDVTEALAALDLDISFFVERGYQEDSATLIVQLVLAALGAVLMLGGTLTATFLSLSDARPDLATLAAVGASPRTRRGVAASYAVVVGLVGAVLGAAVGFIPGIAVTYPMTGGSWVHDLDPSLPNHFLDIPWLLVGGLVLVLPLVTALAVGLTTRSRLPMVARID